MATELAHDGSVRRGTGRRRWAGGALVLCPALLGCAASSPPPEARFWANTYAFGTLGEHEFDVRDVCGARGAERMEVVATPATVLLGVVTLGMYIPRQVQIRCR